MSLTEAAPAAAANEPPATDASAGSGGLRITRIGAAKRTLVVWPESAIPFLLTEHPEAIARIAEVLKPGETLIAGAPRVEGADPATSRVYNAVYVIDDNGEIMDARDKMHLVPFGEYLPFQSFLEWLGICPSSTEMPGGFSAGTVRKSGAARRRAVLPAADLLRGHLPGGDRGRHAAGSAGLPDQRHQ